MYFEEILDQAMAMLQRCRRVTYSTLRLQFQLYVDILKYHWIAVGLHG